MPSLSCDRKTGGEKLVGHSQIFLFKCYDNTGAGQPERNAGWALVVSRKGLERFERLDLDFGVEDAEAAAVHHSAGQQWADSSGSRGFRGWNKHLYSFVDWS